MDNKKTYNIGAFLFACLMMLTSCIDDVESCLDDIPEDITKGYSLNLTVTLDNMGGTRAGGEPNPMKEWEDYIDPEKFRVLFFNDQEEFLFESKSRWIKQLAPTADGFAQWLVSVPMFSYGNDVQENWNWEAIRNALTTNSFKIAILANRPEKEYYPGFSETGLEADPKWIENTGPHWGDKDTSWGGDTPKKLFDLHHCQYDPLYHGKSFDKTYSTDTTQTNFYEFIMGGYNLDKDGKPTTVYSAKRPQMGVTSSWVEWELDKNNNPTNSMVYPKDIDITFKDKSSKTDPKDVTIPNQFNAIRYTVLPSAKRPIPMYGVQKFDPITNWIKGTPFNLSQITTGKPQTGYNFQSIALLRSVVKLELLLSKKLFPTKTEFVTLWYSNIYARCEPMDVWTSTNELWQEHTKGNCEWFNIIQYGPVVSQYLEAKERRKQDSKAQWQQTMSWFYGVWQEREWDFSEHGYSGTVPSTIKYPRIFNTCVQRNKTVLCTKEGDLSEKYSDNYWHYVVYTGERNMIDPNNLGLLSSKNSYATSWIFKDEKNNRFYAIPLASYKDERGNDINSTARGCFGPYNHGDFGDGSSLDLPKNTRNQTSKMYSYGNDVRDLVTNKNTDTEWPWPLMRNHVYRITIGPDEPASANAATRSNTAEDFFVTSEDLHSESLTPQ